MPKKGIDKQVPNEQRGRGLNLEHPEGKANDRNQQRQAAAPASPPRPKKDG